MSDITLLAWNNAATNPPENNRLVITDQGHARYEGFGVWRPCGPQRPTIWCESTPLEPFTLAEMRYYLSLAEHEAARFRACAQEHSDEPEYGEQAAFVERHAARLRAALEAVSAEKGEA